MLTKRAAHFIATVLLLCSGYCPILAAQPAADTIYLSATIDQRFTWSPGRDNLILNNIQGLLPPGISKHSSSKYLDGVPTRTGLFSVRSDLMTADGKVVEHSTLEFDVKPSSGFEIVTTSIPPAFLDRTYLQTINFAGNIAFTGNKEQPAPSLSPGAPPWLTVTTSTVNPNSGQAIVVLSGKPESAKPEHHGGPYKFTLSVTSPSGIEQHASYELEVLPGTPPLSFGAEQFGPATAGMPYAKAVSVAGGADPIKVAILSDTLREYGLSAQLADRRLAVFGTPDKAGTVSLSLEATDAKGIKVTKAFTIQVAPQPTNQSMSLGVDLDARRRTYCASGIAGCLQDLLEKHIEWDRKEGGGKQHYLVTYHSYKDFFEPVCSQREECVPKYSQDFLVRRTTASMAEMKRPYSKDSQHFAFADSDPLGPEELRDIGLVLSSIVKYVDWSRVQSDKLLTQKLSDIQADVWAQAAATAMQDPVTKERIRQLVAPEMAELQRTVADLAQKVEDLQKRLAAK
jgi:hypothetical protein